MHCCSTKIAFGYANLNDDWNAEWGRISIEELEKNGVRTVEGWEPKRFKEIRSGSNV